MAQAFYLVATILLGLAFGLLCTRLASRSKALPLWLATAAVSIGLLILGVWDWRRQAPHETPLLSYVLAAIIPAFAASLASKRSSMQRDAENPRRVIQVAAGAAAVYWAATVAAVLIGMALTVK